LNRGAPGASLGFFVAGRLDAASEFVENTIEKELAKFERQGIEFRKKDREKYAAKLRNRLGLHLCVFVFPVEPIRPRNSCRIIMVNSS
jgi:hypothetical protein